MKDMINVANAVLVVIAMFMIKLYFDEYNASYLIYTAVMLVIAFIVHFFIVRRWKK